MFKYLILPINMLFLFLVGFFTGDNISVTPIFPKEVKPGSEFTLELNIDRKGAEGFAKFQQELPEGFTAKEINSKGASFNLSGQTLKLIWTSMPTDPEFKISYKIIVGENVSGSIPFGGKFSYVEDNVKQVIELSEFAINVVSFANTEVATSNTSETAPVDENEKIETALSENENTNQENNIADNSTTPVSDPSTLSCSRKITPTVNSGEFLVEVTLNKGGISGFAKLQENIPSGYTASGKDIQNSSFTFADQKAKFVWLSIPTEEIFTVSYLLTADNIVSGEAEIEGLFSYLEKDESKRLDVQASAFTFNGRTESIANNLSEQEQSKENSVKEETVKQEEKEPISEALSSVPKPESNVVYKVQIAAIHKFVEVSYFKQIYGLTDKVNTEMHEGWNKYTVGSFGEYKLARDRREEVRLNKVQGPFVTAYNSGKRITVQEALMITSQKWYK